MDELNTAKRIIVLADDDLDDLMIFQDAFNEMNIDISLTITNNGQHLMETLDNTVPPLPDLIFLDLNMPKKNGKECLNEIRSTTKLSQIPVIIISTSQNDETINEMYHMGANYYICKPNDFSTLIKLLKTVLSFSYQSMISQPHRDNFFLTVA